MEYVQEILHLGGVSVPALAERFGTPLYVYEAASIRKQVANVRDAFAALPFRPFYAMKANSNLALLRLIREHGFGCDAVSPGEIHLALRAGFAPESIWFTCSNTSFEDFRAVPDPRIVINLNSVSEIDKIVELGLPNPVALRVNPDVGAGHHADVITAGESVKFGIDLAELETARMLLEDAGSSIVGLHAHIGSGVDSLAPLLASAECLLELIDDFPELRWLNFGGGIATPYRPGDAEFPIAEYGAALARIAGPRLRERNLTAILEPGRYVVAASGVLIARVTTKRVSAGVDWAGVDAGFNDLVRPSKYDAYHHIVNATRGETGALRETYDASLHREEIVVAGNLCESGDVFTRANHRVVTRAIEPLRVGDLVAFCDAGAYGFSMASHYNARLLPAEVLVDGGEARIIRERQGLDDLFRGME
ncbi:MAG: diaminopimelate decarboxylase [Acidobacteria bacterium]|nr:diaminopimelate decarboxylase [Acidobacteriota bacterium]MBV9474508.1 diaminopimelate decarboxylase [Acidobacteriota bacterium]